MELGVAEVYDEEAAGRRAEGGRPGVRPGHPRHPQEDGVPSSPRYYTGSPLPANQLSGPGGLVTDDKSYLMINDI